MDVPLTTILAKMAEEVRKAQSSHNVQQIREHTTAIRTLCDLVLECANRQHSSIMTYELEEQPQPSVAKKEQIEIGDDANGSSLFDF